jgi:hypothetical protein
MISDHIKIKPLRPEEIPALMVLQDYPPVLL